MKDVITDKSETSDSISNTFVCFDLVFAFMILWLMSPVKVNHLSSMAEKEMRKSTNNKEKKKQEKIVQKYI